MDIDIGQRFVWCLGDVIEVGHLDDLVRAFERSLTERGGLSPSDVLAFTPTQLRAWTPVWTNLTPTSTREFALSVSFEFALSVSFTNRGDECSVLLTIRPSADR